MARVKKAYSFPVGRMNWYPGHMVKATRQIEEELKKVNVFVEVLDARIPISSHNTTVDTLLPSKIKKVILLNKADLAQKAVTKQFIEYHKKQGCTVMAINAKDRSKISGFKLLKLLRSVEVPTFPSLGSWFMIGGIPNVGKSTLINCLRKAAGVPSGKGKGAKTAPTPGTTRGVAGFKISTDPLLYMMDTPGVMPTKVESTEIGFRLAVCGCIKDGIVDSLLLCDYLLYCLNQQEVLDYVKIFEMKQPTRSLVDVIDAIVKKQKYKTSQEVATYFLQRFREGLLGSITLDSVPTL